VLSLGPFLRLPKLVGKKFLETPALWVSLVLIGMLPMSITAQEKVNLESIDQKKVRKYLVERDLLQLDAFWTLGPTCSKVEESFSYISQEFVFNYPLEQVWKIYKEVDAQDAWNGRIVSLGCAFSKQEGRLCYNNDPDLSMQEGQVLFFNLRLMKGVFNLATAHEVTQINEDEHFIQFCYLEEGKSQGSQTIFFKELTDGSTLVTHDSQYRNQSKFRERRLYPPFHIKCVEDLHQNMQRLIEQRLGE
jgi:hypothetical protein